MNRKPAEKYYQSRGRPHSGLRDPEKFGLTYNQVVALIDAGAWKSFYDKWRYRNGGIETDICKACEIPLIEGIDFVRINGDKICKNCVSQIQELARNG